jgi:dGTPase
MNKKEIAQLKNELEILRRLTERQHQDTPTDKHRPWDNQFQRDHARILYSSEFRRLGGKMQLFAIDPCEFYRTRLTHSLEVAQIARSICLTLNKKLQSALWGIEDLFLIEAISLAHDLGTPPFAHAGERVLNNLACDIGGFESNAQTLRIITTLAQKHPTCPGLNLTKRTILGVVKYFAKYIESDNTEKFLYQDDYELIEQIFHDADISLDSSKMTLDCKIMNLADEIAYAAHDLEDALRLKYLNVDDLIHLFNWLLVKSTAKEEEKDKMLKSIKQLERIIKYPKAAADFTGTICSNYETFDIYETILRKELSSSIVYDLVNDVTCIKNNDNIEIGLKKHDFLKTMLKDILYPSLQNVTEKLMLYEKVGEKVLNGLFEVFMDKQFNKDNELLGSAYRGKGKLNDSEKKRHVIDYIAGMTEEFALSQYKSYFGNDPFKEGFYTNYHQGAKNGKA